MTTEFQSKIEFKPWAKTTRLFREIVITEKIDGTNAAVQIIKADNISHWKHEDDSRTFFDPQPLNVVNFENEVYIVYAQSRNRLIFPGQDNAGFAGWVAEHAYELVQYLGEGVHYGEWWGQGIQRGYGLKQKRFSLFNTYRFNDITAETDGLIRSVPILYKGVFNQFEVEEALHTLKTYGSEAAEGFMNPEGICIYHSQTKLVQKVTLDNNDSGKWEQN